MRSRLLTIISSLTLVLTSLAVFGLSSPASADCSHPNHPDLYGAGGIHWGDGTAIHTGPHLSCTVVGRGYPSHGIDVHCATETGSLWLFVRNLTTGVNGWVRYDALRYDGTVRIADCASGLAAAHQVA